MATKYARTIAAPVAHYKLNDNAASTVVVDEKGTNGTWAHGNTADHKIAGVSANTGGSTGAMTFDKTNDYVDMGQAFTSVFNSDFTWSAWVKPSTGWVTGTQQICSAYDAAGTEDYISFQIASSTGSFQAQMLVAGGSYQEAHTGLIFSVGENDWTHLVAVFDKSVASSSNEGFTLYVNGVLYAGTQYSGSAVPANWTSTENPYIGARNVNGTPGNRYGGGVDDLRIYDSALNAGEISAIYNAGAGTEEDIVSLGWDSDESWSTSSGGAADTTKAIAGDDAILDGNSGNIKIDAASACSTIDCTGYTNTLTQEADLTTTGAVTLVSGMTFTYSSGVWYIGADTITSAGKTFGSVNFNDTGTYTLSDTMDISTLLEVSTGVTATLATSDITLSGSLTATGTGVIAGRTITLNGTGTWSASSAEFMHSGDLIINTAGTITLGDNAGMQSGTLTGIAGTIAGGTFHIEDSCILDASAITFPDVTVGSLAAADITLSDDFNCTILRVDNNTTFDTSGGAYNVNCTSMIGVDGFYGYNPFTLYTDKEFLAYSDLTSSYLNISNPHPKPGSDTLDTLASFQLLLRSPSGVDVDEEGHIWILSEDRNTLYALDAMYDYFLTDKENRWVYFRENYSDPGVFIKPA